MSYFSEMEWSSKWDWGNLVTFGSKAMGSPKKLQFPDWKIVAGEIDSGSLDHSGGGVNSGASFSDGGHGSSAKSSISAATDSSTFRFMTLEGSSGNFSKKMETKGTQVSGTSPTMNSVEPWIGLKLEKRTYFENNGAGGSVKNTSLSLMPTPSATAQKKRKGSAQNASLPRCQVEGCNIDLSTAKDYHKKHRVCDRHSKCSKVIVGGLERRFCQQCSRFHGLSEFDERKRSCRRRLSDHNARRRKPHQETIQFNSTRLSSPFYGNKSIGGRQQMSFLLNNAPLAHSRTPANPTWDSTGISKFTLTKYGGDGCTDEQLHMLGTKLPHAINTRCNSPFKSSTPEFLSPGSHLEAAAPEYRQALSLLSCNSWGSSGPNSVPVHHHHHPMAENDTNMSQHMMHAIPEVLPLSCTDFWLSGQHPRVQSMATNSNFQEIQLLKTPYEADFYTNILN